MNIEIKTVDWNILPYIGYTIIDTKLGNEIVEVPFLVTKQRIAQPIIGYNVISSIARTRGKNDTSLLSNLKECFPSDICVESVIAVVDESNSISCSSVKTPKMGIKIKAGTANVLNCLRR